MMIYVEGMEKASKLLIGFCFKDVFLSWSLSWFSVGPIESYFTLVSGEISEGNLSVEGRKVLPKQKAAKPRKKKERKKNTNSQHKAQLALSFLDVMKREIRNTRIGALIHAKLWENGGRNKDTRARRVAYWFMSYVCKIACSKIIKVLEPITMHRLVWFFDGPFVILAWSYNSKIININKQINQSQS